MDKLSLSILELYEERRSLSLYDVALILNEDVLDVVSPPVADLLGSGLLAGATFGASTDPLQIDTKLKITQSGRKTLYEEKQEIKNKKYKLFIDWLHISLTLAAVIISIIALAKQ